MDKTNDSAERGGIRGCESHDVWRLDNGYVCVCRERDRSECGKMGEICTSERKKNEGRRDETRRDGECGASVWYAGERWVGWYGASVRWGMNAYGRMPGEVARLWWTCDESERVRKIHRWRTKCPHVAIERSIAPDHLQRRWLRLVRLEAQPREQNTLPAAAVAEPRDLLRVLRVRDRLIVVHRAAVQGRGEVRTEGERKLAPWLAHACRREDVEVDLAVWMLVADE